MRRLGNDFANFHDENDQHSNLHDILQLEPKQHNAGHQTYVFPFSLGTSLGEEDGGYMAR